MVPDRPEQRARPWILANWQRADDTLAQGLIGPPRPLQDTLTDSIRSMASAGQLTPAEAGRLA